MSSTDALGTIETRGLTGAVEIVDATVKTADATSIGKEQIDGGLVTVMARSGVGAIKVVADAGVAAAERAGELLFIHVIPCPHTEVDATLPYITTEL